MSLILSSFINPMCFKRGFVVDKFKEQELLKLNFTHAEIAIISEILTSRLINCKENINNLVCVGCKKRWTCKKICKKLQNILPKELEKYPATISLVIGEIDPTRENK